MGEAGVRYTCVCVGVGFTVKEFDPRIRLESQLQKHTFHMTTGLLVSRMHFLHIFAVIKISAVKVCTQMWGIRNKSSTSE